MTARDLFPGMILVMRTGPVRVLARREHLGGVELRVVSASATPGTGKTRTLWFYGCEAVTAHATPEGLAAPPGHAAARGGAQP